jgi:hypothetical protein
VLIQLAFIIASIVVPYLTAKLYSVSPGLTVTIRQLAGGPQTYGGVVGVANAIGGKYKTVPLCMSSVVPTQFACSNRRVLELDLSASAYTVSSAETV